MTGHTHRFPSYNPGYVIFKFYLVDNVPKENKIVSLGVLLVGRRSDLHPPTKFAFFNEEIQLSSANIYHLTQWPRIKKKKKSFHFTAKIYIVDLLKQYIHLGTKS